jgi:D-glycero-D-manno-heptose 1,7-bisphosphate phosphatase
MHKAIGQVGGRLDAIFFWSAYLRLEVRVPQAAAAGDAARDRHALQRRPAGVPCVGDSLRDLQARESVGAQPMLVLTGKGERRCATAASRRTR